MASLHEVIEKQALPCKARMGLGFKLCILYNIITNVDTVLASHYAASRTHYDLNVFEITFPLPCD